MKSVCPMVCQKNEKRVTHALQTSKQNPLYTPQQTTNKTLAKPFSKPCSKPSKPLQTLAPLEGLTFSALKQKQAGWIQSKVSAFAEDQPIKHTNQWLRLSKPTFYIQIKGFPRNITKHTKRRRPDHSTNPCGKPSFSLPPWGGLWGWIQISSAFLLPLEGAGGEYNQRFALQTYRFPSLACRSVFSPKPEQTSTGAK